MSKIRLLSIFFFFSFFIQAQLEKGGHLVGFSSGIGLTGNIASTGFSTIKVKDGEMSSNPTKVFALNLSPRYGYFVSKSIVLGFDAGVTIQNVKQENFDNTNTKTRIFQIGPFARFYIPKNTVHPFIEIAAAFGSSNTNVTVPNGFLIPDNPEVNQSLFGVGGGFGISSKLGNRVTFDTLISYSSVSTKDTDDNPNDARLVNNSFILRLGFSIYLGKS